MHGRLFVVGIYAQGVERPFRPVEQRFTAKWTRLEVLYVFRRCVVGKVGHGNVPLCAWKFYMLNLAPVGHYVWVIVGNTNSFSKLVLALQMPWKPAILMGYR